MRNWFLKTNFVGLFSAAVLGLGCQPEGPKTPNELINAYTSVWKAIPREDDPLHRELFQLAFPTTTRVSVWHLYDREKKTRDGLTHFGIRRKAARDEPVKFDRSRRYVPGTYQEDDVLPMNAPKAERIDFNGLDPNTEYEVLYDGLPILMAKTKPEVTPDAFSFLAFSCNNPFAVMTQSVRGKNVELHSREWHEYLGWSQNSLHLFASRANEDIKIDGYARPAFSLGLGDQVYVDGDNKHGNVLSIFEGGRSQPTFKATESFHRMLDVVYRAHFGMPYFDAGLQGAPAALIWDDHELQDGWGTNYNALPPEYGRYFKEALGAFLGYQGLRNPDPPPMHEQWSRSMDVRFDWGKNVRVMLLDTRSIKLPVTELDKGKEFEPWNAQLASVTKWLDDAPKDQPVLFVLGLASPISVASSDFRLELMKEIIEESKSLVKRAEAADDLEDLWISKEVARRALLTKLATHFMGHRKHRLLILSGDVHFSGINYLSTGKGSAWHMKSRNALESDFQSKACGVPANDRASEDVVWGWEVITSGITNDAFPAWYMKWLMVHGTILDGATASSKPLLSAWPRATIFGSPSFSELLVKKSPEKLDVRVVFYPSVYKDDTRDRGQLINHAEKLERSDAWKTTDYNYGKGSPDNCSQACGPVETVTTIPLDWMCIPKTPTTKTLKFPKNCAHACSDILRKKGNPQWAAR